MSKDRDPANDVTSLEQLVGCAFDAMWVIDEDDIIQFMNSAAEVLSGFSADELIGAPLARILPPDIAKQHLGYTQRYVEDGGPSSVLGKIREFEIVARSGERVPIELRAFEISASGGKRRFGAVMHDIGARRAAEETQRQLLEKMQHLAAEDELTGLPNRRAFFDALEREVSATSRHGHPACIGIINIDRFRQVNDSYGHDAGDRALKAITVIMKATLRCEDLIARIGGEEFAILFPDTKIDAASTALERLLQAVRQTPIELSDDVALSLTVGAGVAPLGDDRNGAACLQAADIALLRAKETGGDRICTHSDDIASKSAAE